MTQAEKAAKEYALKETGRLEIIEPWVREVIEKNFIAGWEAATERAAKIAKNVRLINHPLFEDADRVDLEILARRISNHITQTIRSQGEL